MSPFPNACARSGVMLGIIIHLMLCLTGCGGMKPEEQGGALLAQAGYPEETIVRVACRRPLGHDLVVALYALRNDEVFYLVGSNPHLSPEEMGLFLNSPIEFARVGAAANPRLTIPDIERLAKDDSARVCGELAMNQQVPMQVLRTLRARGLVETKTFLWNKNCPPEILAEVEASQDEQAKQVLETARRSVPTWSGADYEQQLFDWRKNSALAYKRRR